MPAPTRKPLMRSLGEFFGEVWKGVRADPGAKSGRATVRHEVREETHDTPAGKVTLRRTVVEEMQLEPPTPQKEKAP